jgi:N-glycosylase/DNA lyase
MNMPAIYIDEDEFNGPFSLFHTINCEQCPADIWVSSDNGYYTHFKLDEKWVRPFVIQRNGGLEVKVMDSISEKELKRVKDLILYQFWHEYDLPGFYQEFSSDHYMFKLIKACRGLRVMRDWNLFWRFIEGICTQNASVKRIRNMNQAIRMNFGEKITFSDQEVFYAFPKPEVLAKESIEKLRERGKVGYRAKYIKAAAELVVGGNLNLIELKDVPTHEARKILTAIEGIGPKVADIIMLYGLGKSDSFPMDRWIKRGPAQRIF